MHLGSEESVKFFYQVADIQYVNKSTSNYDFRLQSLPALSGQIRFTYPLKQ